MHVVALYVMRTTQKRKTRTFEWKHSGCQNIAEDKTISEFQVLRTSSTTIIDILLENERMMSSAALLLNSPCDHFL